MAQFAIIGLGNFGSTVARQLAQGGHEVIGIDRAGERVAAIADELAHAVTADSTDTHVLRELGIDQCGIVLVAIGEDIEASLLTTLALKDLHVARVWAKANDERHYRILSRLGADRIVRPEYDAGCRTAVQMQHDGLDEFLEFGAGQLVLEVHAPPSLAGKRKADFSDVRILAHRRGNQLFWHDEAIREGDALLLLGTRDCLDRFDSR